MVENMILIRAFLGACYAEILELKSIRLTSLFICCIHDIGEFQNGSKYQFELIIFLEALESFFKSSNLFKDTINFFLEYLLEVPNLSSFLEELYN